MTLRAFVALAIVLSAESATAQAILPRVEVFTTIGGIVGLTPVLIDNARRLGLHGGFRADAGIQGETLGLAVGARLWELAPTQSFGGHGLDAFLTAEWRVSFDTRSTLRASVGGGFDDIDGGRGPERAGVGTSGVMFSVGAAREVIPPSGERLIISADLVLPSVNADVGGRRRPILELGFGYRLRGFNLAGTRPAR